MAQKEIRPPEPAHADKIYQLKISIKYTEPLVWRSVQVPTWASLADLHNVIQFTFDWIDDHMHEFEVKGAAYKDVADALDQYGEDYVALGWAAWAVRSKINYVYDFGDSWKHEIVVQKILPVAPHTKYPVCVGGERAAPPDDCGGAWRFASYVAQLRLPKSKRDEELLEEMEYIMGEDFDPDAFDADKVNAKLQHLSLSGTSAEPRRDPDDFGHVQFFSVNLPVD